MGTQTGQALAAVIALTLVAPSVAEVRQSQPAPQTPAPTAAAASPQDASVHLNLAVVLAQLGRFDEARTEAVTALRLRPDYPQARGLLDALPKER